MTLDTEIAEELAAGYSCDGYEPVGSQEVSEHRWYFKRLIVFAPPIEGNGNPPNLYGFHYNDAKLEDALDREDRFDAIPVPTFLVKVCEITVTTYERA